jgi:hypothetical protein
LDKWSSSLSFTELGKGDAEMGRGRPLPELNLTIEVHNRLLEWRDAARARKRW